MTPPHVRHDLSISRQHQSYIQVHQLPVASRKCAAAAVDLQNSATAVPLIDSRKSLAAETPMRRPLGAAAALAGGSGR